MITATYQSPLGAIQLVADERGLTGLWFADAYPDALSDEFSRATPVVPFCNPEPSGTEMEEIAGTDSESGASGMNCEHPGNAVALGVIERTWGWLNSYFAGQAPLWLPPLRLEGGELEHEVCAALLAVPYGETVSLDELALRVGRRFAGDGALTTGPDEVAASVQSLAVSLVVPAHRLEDSQGVIGQNLRDFERASLRSR